MTTKPLIHPRHQGLHPSIYPGSWLPEPSIQTTEPFIHPVTRVRVRVSIQTMTTCSPSIQGVRVKTIEPFIHPNQGHRSQTTYPSEIPWLGSNGYPSIQGHRSQDHRPTEPQVTRVTGHWVAHPSQTTEPFVHPDTRVMVTGSPSIHPDQGHMALHPSRVTGSWSPSIQTINHPSIQGVRVIDHKAIYPSKITDPGHRP